ncbi:MAG TPA: hypothetical protein VLK34_06965 [Nocardioidaceae bacterium]|nr:hypothetical protein [Nocardioidaceae bacterium]
MNTLAAVAVIAAMAVAAWYLVRLARMVRSDGYTFRASSGLPRDWSPSPDLPSLPYIAKPHH